MGVWWLAGWWLQRALKIDLVGVRNLKQRLARTGLHRHINASLDKHDVHQLCAEEVE